MVESNQTTDTDIYIFCFGSNGPKQLCERIGADYQELMGRTLPAVAKGWLRGFKSLASTWGGRSTATIWETGKEEDTVLGTVVKMTKQEVESLDPYEAYPFKYDRKEIKLTAFKVSEGKEESTEGFELNCQAYVIHEHKYNDFAEPSDEYKLACCKTIYTARRLLGQGGNRDISLQIYNAATKEHTGEFKYSITDDDIKNL